ncbi:hypothetical protein CBL_07749 [Carabus blaptoides fortunei]
MGGKPITKPDFRLVFEQMTTAFTEMEESRNEVNIQSIHRKCTWDYVEGIIGKSIFPSALAKLLNHTGTRPSALNPSPISLRAFELDQATSIYFSPRPIISTRPAVVMRCNLSVIPGEIVYVMKLELIKRLHHRRANRTQEKTRAAGHPERAVQGMKQSYMLVELFLDGALQEKQRERVSSTGELCIS